MDEDVKYIDKAVFLEQLKYLREVQKSSLRYSWDYIKLNDIEWFIKLVEEYPKCSYGFDLNRE